MKPTANTGKSTAYPNLKPFTKNDPRINKSGLDAKTRNFRKKLARMDKQALALLEKWMTSGDFDQETEAMKFFGKYRLPVPTEKTPEETSTSTQTVMSADLAARLAALDVQ